MIVIIIIIIGSSSTTTTSSSNMNNNSVTITINSNSNARAPDRRADASPFLSTRIWLLVAQPPVKFLIFRGMQPRSESSLGVPGSSWSGHPGRVGCI